MMIRRQDDNVHDNNDENKYDADDDAGFRDTTGDINVEIMMKMSIHFLIAILLPFDGLFSPPVLHSFVCMIFAQYRNYSQITCKFFVTLSKAK